MQACTESRQASQITRNWLGTMSYITLSFPFLLLVAKVTTTQIIDELLLLEWLVFALYHRHECFTGKYTSRKIHLKAHPGPEWRIFHILTSEDIDA